MSTEDRENLPLSKPPRAASKAQFSRRLCLALASIIFTLLVFEGGLRITGAGRIRQLTLAGDRASLIPIKRLGPERFDPGQFPLPIKSSPKRHRVFFFGGSSTQGFPYPQYSYPAFFKAALNPSEEAGGIQAVNLGLLQGAVRDARHLLEELLAWGVRPDAVVIHCANNELYYNRVRILNEAHRPGRRLLKVLRRYSQIAALIDDRVPSGKVPEDPEELHRLYPLHEENLRLVIQTYEEDLLRIIDCCRKGKSPLVLTTVPLNRDYWAPRFLAATERDSSGSHEPDARASSLSREDIKRRLKSLVSQAEKLFYEGNFSQAAAICRKVLKVLPDEPQSNFYLGRILLAEGRIEEARTKLERALRWDLVHAYRPVPALNESVRRIARRFQDRGVYLIDFDQHLLDTHGINGRKLFIDNCHGKPETYLEMGLLAAGFFAEKRLLGKAPVSRPDETIHQRLRSRIRIEKKSIERTRIFVEKLLKKDSPFLQKFLNGLDDQ